MVNLTFGRWNAEYLTPAEAPLINLLCPTPPLAEQAQIVAEVERRLSQVDDLDVAVAAKLNRAERLWQAILKRAFEGRLVPQDPADEPADALLECLRGPRCRQGTNRFHD
jgi:type I restriction enzyme S subunit